MKKGFNFGKWVLVIFALMMILLGIYSLFDVFINQVIWYHLVVVVLFGIISFSVRTKEKWLYFATAAIWLINVIWDLIRLI
ncbi:hypothetical protein FKV75_05965 [Weissella paramesenteroides]|uniref:hypothetical protein n=1 Tax=Weissella paramesenteroides TaxID=1249 RepID=UPI00123B3034|nr:hypothetical protein [Weissella paramesenteroides]KAA8442106.1 hypothetical protein FKV81_02830 [Weissella paramesenteroides]KAA8442350.1 hypothetical protein FKV75_05965 [Weissella paramesenteroides]KAA8443744.1 hypothetical protein FKV77_03255 [Weissella paramesenteroides]KAA8447245.1 hypothetical protein FKV76_05680 [Weissella paramesenteroides]KAA8450090.1 hypothetical protein FKV74_04235 [Weissella paramesenteroides]